MGTHNHIITPILLIWGINCVLGMAIAFKQIWFPHILASNTAYLNIQSEPFDGTVYPLTYIPDWTKIVNQDKSKRFEDISISEYIPLPQYDLSVLSDDRGITKSSLLGRYTYITLYMGSYKLNYKENDGGHPGVDIRAPIGTPVLSIANGIVVRAVEGDVTGNKFVVVRHDSVPQSDGTLGSIYSGYLHLSEILIREGTKVRKGDMIGRVGITGITTTPHLHFQIDTSTAPFHPYWHFTSSDSKSAGLGFYESVNSGLNKEMAEKYTIHPMRFVEQYLGGVTPRDLAGDSPQGALRAVTFASRAIDPDKICEKKRYRDVAPNSTLGRILYRLVDEHCLFQSENSNFHPNESITRREAIQTIMDYYKISQSVGVSQFLDIPIGDELQGYAISAVKKGILYGNYFYPDQIITKEDFIELLVTIGNFPKNPSQMKIYADVDNLNPKLSALQDYGYMVRARGGKIYPKNILTRQIMIQILGSVKKQ